jgi:hypothetical protein
MDSRRRRQYAWLGTAFGTRAARPPPAAGVGWTHCGATPEGVHTSNSRCQTTQPSSFPRRVFAPEWVILVDNATQPMQAGPLAAMKELVSSGNAAKLIFSFTWLDRVTGDNLPTPPARQQHVLASAENVLAAIGEELGPFAERALRSRLGASRVFLANLDQKLDQDSAEGRRTIKQLAKLLEMIDGIVERSTPSESRPVYGTMNLGFAIKAAIETFHSEWRARLGQPSESDLDKAPWQKVKALSRRFATQMSDEYDYLRPVKDLQQKAAAENLRTSSKSSFLDRARAQRR